MTNIDITRLQSLGISPDEIWTALTHTGSWQVARGSDATAEIQPATGVEHGEV